MLCSASTRRRKADRRKAAIAATAFAVMSSAAVLVVHAPGASATGTGTASRIKAAAQRTCIDVSTTDPSRYFDDVYGHTCDASSTQLFDFRTITGAPANTYEVVNESSGLCLDQDRFSIRQESCVGTVPPDYTNVEWTLQRVAGTGRRYRFEVTSTIDTASPRCLQVFPRPHGYPGPVFDLTACDTNQAAQVFTLGAAL